jgi:hypothetical protein
MTPEQIAIAKQEAADERNAPKIEKAYMGSLTSTEPKPAPKKPVEKKAKGGSISGNVSKIRKSADGIAQRGKTRGRIV